MAYLSEADFRKNTLAEYCAGVPLSATEAGSAALTAAIARMETRFNEWTNDDFNSTSGGTITIDGQAKSRLFLPVRTRSVSAVVTIASDGSTTTEGTSNYKLRSSLNAAGTVAEGDYDWISVIPGRTISTGAKWAAGVQNIRVTGNFGWAAVPGDVKRAVALLVFDHFKPLRQDLRRVDSYDTQDARFNLAASEPSGIPEVDAIIAAYTRPEPPEV